MKGTSNRPRHDVGNHSGPLSLGLGFRVLGLGFRVLGLGFRVSV